MAGYHYTIIVGNVGREPELRYIPSGTAVTSFTVAVNEVWNDRGSGQKKDKTTWYRVTAWAKQAETVNQVVRKGAQIMVAGTMQEPSAFLGKDGQPRASLEMRLQTFQLLGSRSDNMSSGEGGYGGYQGSNDSYDDFRPPGGDDEIPF